jgi:predicted transcriptional regulator
MLPFLFCQKDAPRYNCSVMQNCEFKKQRAKLRLSQSALARLAGVSRIRICLHELGDLSLTTAELLRIDQAMRREAKRIHADAEEILEAVPSRKPRNELTRLHRSVVDPEDTTGRLVHSSTVERS